MHKLSITLFVLFTTWSACVPAAASGSYRARPPRPGGSLNARQYHLGKCILKKKVELGEKNAEVLDEQERILTAIQKKLPKRAKLPKLEKFAGKLTEKQLEAVRYYLTVRYKVKLEED